MGRLNSPKFDNDVCLHPERVSSRLPRKKFDPTAANKLWNRYTENLVNSISESEKEGLEKGYSSFEIEKLWQSKLKKTAIGEKKQNSESNET